MNYLLITTNPMLLVLKFFIRKLYYKFKKLRYTYECQQLIIKTSPQLIKTTAAKKMKRLTLTNTRRHEFYMLDLHGICIFSRRVANLLLYLNESCFYYWRLFCYTKCTHKFFYDL